MNNWNEEKINNTVQEYITVNKKKIDKEFDFYRESKNIDELIHKAVFAILPDGKRNPHQRRISEHIFKDVEKNILKIKETFNNFKTFDEILSVIEENKVKGFGKLAVYDTALRIGMYFNIYPKAVYMHAGTKGGARNLGLNVKREYIPKNEFPQSFMVLEPYEIECILCIYKDNFK